MNDRMEEMLPSCASSWSLCSRAGARVGGVMSADSFLPLHTSPKDLVTQKGCVSLRAGVFKGFE